MFPLRDENPALHKTIGAFGIIGVNAAVWALIQGFGAQPALTRSVCEFGVIPGELLGTVEPGTSVALSKTASCVIESSANWWTLLTSMFMHGGWFHIIGNMWFLAVFGDNVEDSMGTVRFIAFYLLCGLAASGVQIAFSPQSPVPMVGASGAIGGVLGAYAVLYPRARVHMLVFLGFFITRFVTPAFFVLGYWFLLQLFGALPTIGTTGGGVAFFAHVGGFLAGVGLVFLFRDNKRVEEHRQKIERRWHYES